MPEPLNQDPAHPDSFNARVRAPIQGRTLAVLKLWAARHPYDFFDDDLMALLGAFATAALDHDCKTDVRATLLAHAKEQVRLQHKRLNAEAVPTDATQHQHKVADAAGRRPPLRWRPS